jgi:hypothetical protein
MAADATFAAAGACEDAVGCDFFLQPVNPERQLTNKLATIRAIIICVFVFFILFALQIKVFSCDFGNELSL